MALNHFVLYQFWPQPMAFIDAHDENDNDNDKHNRMTNIATRHVKRQRINLHFELKFIKPRSTSSSLSTAATSTQPVENTFQK